MLIAAHGNALRVLVMRLEHISRERITNLNLPTGIPLAYHLGENLEVLHKEYLGDTAAIEAKMQAVANQGKIQAFYFSIFVEREKHLKLSFHESF